MKKEVLFIINPISGTRHKQSIPEEIERWLDHTLFDHEIKFTTHAGHASELTKEAAENGVDIVVAVGGDGTVNEVARSLVHTSTALGIIPCGSGNGLARHLQIPQTPRGAIEILNQNVIHCLDYGKINGKPFFCTCGMGFDAFVSKKFADSGKRGLLQYAKNTIGVGLTYQSKHYILEYNGQKEELDAFLIACANASQYGNNAYIAPTASMKDGLMDVIVMKPFPTIEGAYVLLQMFTKTLLNNNHVQLSQTKKLHVKRTQPGAVHIDGDPVMMGCDIDVELVPHSFNVVVNPKAHDKKRITSRRWVNAWKNCSPSVPTAKRKPRILLNDRATKAATTNSICNASSRRKNKVTAERLKRFATATRKPTGCGLSSHKLLASAIAVWHKNTPFPAVLKPKPICATLFWECVYWKSQRNCSSTKA